TSREKRPRSVPGPSLERRAPRSSRLRDGSARCGVLMIGVVARADEHDVAREFFELFKTPWEFWRGTGRYDVLVDTDRGISLNHRARLVLLYGSEPGAFDHHRERRPGPPRNGAVLSWRGDQIPVYGRCGPLSPGEEPAGLVFQDTREPAVTVVRADGRT